MHSMKSISLPGKLTLAVVVTAGFALQHSARAGTLIVNANAPGCSPTGPVYCQIQDAVNAAAPGDVILVSGGSYAPITVATDDITIQAVNGSEVIIDAMGVPGSDGVTLNANGVTVRGLIAQNAALLLSPPYPGGKGFAVNGTAIKLYGNTARSNRDGFIVAGDSNTLVGNTSSDNVVSGIALLANSNTVINNTCTGNNNGFAISASQLNILRGNLAEGNNSRGFFLIFFADNNTLQDNVARENGKDGYFLLYGSSSNLLQGNRAKGNGTAMYAPEDFGFIVGNESDNNTLVDNVADGNTGQGFVVYDSDSNTLEANLASNNAKGGFVLIDVGTPPAYLAGGTTNNLLKANTARDNIGDGFAVLSGPDPTDFNLLENNSSLRNTGWGYYVETLLSNTFENNNCQLNALGGANLPGICH
jgi:parallel beta-helix repeat protein